MSTDPRVAHFDAIAEQWDNFHDAAALARDLSDGLTALGVGDGEQILDVGCGTGALAVALLAKLGPLGRVVGVDVSPRMIAIARRKVADDRARFFVADAKAVPLRDGEVDRVFCYSVWPHLGEPTQAARELRRVLRPRGSLHVWHSMGRDKVNSIHAGAGPAVREDVLDTGNATSRVLEDAGFRVIAVIDEADCYLVSARREEG